MIPIETDGCLSSFSFGHHHDDHVNMIYHTFLTCNDQHHHNSDSADISFSDRPGFDFGFWIASDRSDS